MAVPDLPSAYKAVEVLQSYTPGCVVLTLGEKGVLFTEKGKPDIVRHQEAEKVKVVDTTVSIRFPPMYVYSMIWFYFHHVSYIEPN